MSEPLEIEAMTVEELSANLAEEMPDFRMPPPNVTRRMHCVEESEWEEIQERIEDCYDTIQLYRDALIAIANQDYRGPKPPSVDMARRALGAIE